MNDLMSHQFMKDVDGGPARWLLASPAGSQAKRGSNKVEGKPKNEIAGGGAITCLSGPEDFARTADGLEGLRHSTSLKMREVPGFGSSAKHVKSAAELEGMAPLSVRPPTRDTRAATPAASALGALAAKARAGGAAGGLSLIHI